jgi:putative membrane protein
MLRIIFHFLVNVLLILGLSYILPGFGVSGFTAASIFIVILTVLNWTILPVIKILALPITLLTLGLFNIILNLVVVIVVANFVPGISIVGTDIDKLFIAAVISLALAFGNGLVNTVEQDD